MHGWEGTEISAVTTEGQSPCKRAQDAPSPVLRQTRAQRKSSSPGFGDWLPQPSDWIQRGAQGTFPISKDRRDQQPTLLSMISSERGHLQFPIRVFPLLWRVQQVYLPLSVTSNLTGFPSPFYLPCLLSYHCPCLCRQKALSKSQVLHVDNPDSLRTRSDHGKPLQHLSMPGKISTRECRFRGVIIYINLSSERRIHALLRQ